MENTQAASKICEIPAAKAAPTLQGKATFPHRQPLKSDFNGCLAEKMAMESDLGACSSVEMATKSGSDGVLDGRRALPC